MKNYKLIFRMGTALFTIGAVLFVTAFFVPEGGKPPSVTDANGGKGLASGNISSDITPPIAPQPSEQLTEEEIIAMAEGLGMTFETEEDVSDHSDDAVAEETDTVHIVIPRGLGSNEIAAMLQTAGIIDDALQFAAFVTNEGMSHSLNAGEYDIEKGLEYQDVLKVISMRYAIRNR